MRKLIVLFSLVVVHEAAAWSGPISRPESYPPKGCPPEAMKQVEAALNRKDCKFEEGSFFNLSAQWSYRGNTEALNGFLKALSECPGTRLVISTNQLFRWQGDWSVYASPVSEHFFFKIDLNPKSKLIDLNGLKIPSLHGPQLKIAESAKIEIIKFAERLKLTNEQEKLLRLRKRLGKEADDGPPELKQELDILEKQLGADAVVRTARAKELTLEPGQERGISFVHNSTMENLVFNVAIRGDEVQRGSTKMSVAHETWLPPGGRLRVKDLYWTTPAMQRTK
ncbi:MAG: hypothetical protein ACPGVU_00120 [Limisphaerales bacterium]